MEMHQLRYFVAVARAENFSRAAEQCHVAQPSLSQQIQKLEDELGERLFERLQRSVRLTAAGQLFLPRAIRILEEVEAAKREASDAKACLGGTLTIGVLPTIAPYLLPAALTAFVKAHPAVEVIVHEDTTARLLRLARAFEIDFALASEPINDDRVEIQELFVEELLLAVPPKHPLAKKERVQPEDLEKEPLLVMKEGHCLGEQVLRFCERREVQANISFRSAQLETIRSLVRAGLGISLIPAMAAAPVRPRSPVYRLIEGKRATRNIVAVWPKQRPLNRAAMEFLKLVHQPAQPGVLPRAISQRA